MITSWRYSTASDSPMRSPGITPAPPSWRAANSTRSPRPWNCCAFHRSGWSIRCVWPATSCTPPACATGGDWRRFGSPHLRGVLEAPAGIQAGRGLPGDIGRLHLGHHPAAHGGATAGPVGRDLRVRGRRLCPGVRALPRGAGCPGRPVSARDSGRPGRPVGGEGGGGPERRRQARVRSGGRDRRRPDCRPVVRRAHRRRNARRYPTSM